MNLSARIFLISFAISAFMYVAGPTPKRKNKGLNAFKDLRLFSFGYVLIEFVNKTLWDNFCFQNGLILLAVRQQKHSFHLRAI